ncbi:MAG: GRP family sugar transporter [Thermomicrobiales bacterium]
MKGAGVGAAAALASAAFWAATNLILRGQIGKVGGATAQTWRTTVSALISLPIFLIFRELHDLSSIPGRTVAVLLLSVLLSMVIGDILQFTAVRRLGVALALPISSSYPLFTLIIAAVFLAEALTPRAIGGVLLVITGVILVALPRRALVEEGAADHAAPSSGHWVGVACAVASALCSAGATTLTRLAITHIDVLSANLLRLPFSAILCAVISTAQRRQPPWRVERGGIVPLCAAGVTGLASGLCYLTAIKTVGASTTATLNAASPIFGLLGAVLVLRERPTRRSVVGTVIAFVGIVLVV